MYINTLKISFFSVILLLSTTACANEHCHQEYAAGNALVYIINAPEKVEGEQYADWSNYLNEFAGQVGKGYVFKKVTSKQLGAIMKNAAAYNQAYSMIFMKKGKPSYVYEGPILEPQVYRFVQLMYAGESIEPPYLKQFSPDVIKIELLGCQ